MKTHLGYIKKYTKFLPSYLLNILLDLLFPKSCIHCSSPDVKDDQFLCSKCDKEVVKCDTNACMYCGLPLPPYENEFKEYNKKFKISINKCDFCFENRYYFDLIFCGSLYNDIMSSLASGLKFANQTQNASFFACMIVSSILQNNQNNFLQIDVIACTPISYRRLLSRGYNQSALIASLVYKKLKKHKEYENVLFLPSLLQKIKHTKPQTSLTKAQRIENIKDCFDINQKLCKILIDKGVDLKTKNIIIIDDIATTMSTINECCLTIRKKLKPKYVFSAIAARVDII
jgi:predicted amidophosphoribosyltransferase